MASNVLDIQLSISLDVPDISMQVDRRWKNIDFEVDKGGPAYLPYTGPYEADASFYYDTTLETFGKVMTDNVKVNKIPIIESSNPQGGKTIIIGA